MLSIIKLIEIFKEVKKNKTKFIMLLPAILFFIVLAYLPMIGVIVAFKKYTYEGGFFGSPWIGLENFKFFLITNQIFTVTRNTILYNLAFLVINNFLEIVIAIILSEIFGKYIKRFMQSVMFLPYFISWVVVGAFIYNIFNYEFGALNTLLQNIGLERMDVYSNEGIWKYIIVVFSAWKIVGYGTVIYLAAIMGIDSQIYEAADIDGANIYHKVKHITLPSLIPTIIILVLLSIGNIMRGDFAMFYQIVGNNSLVLEQTDVIDTFVVRSLLDMQEFGMSAAAGLYQSVFGFALIMTVNWLIRKYDKDYSLF